MGTDTLVRLAVLAQTVVLYSTTSAICMMAVIVETPTCWLVVRHDELIRGFDGWEMLSVVRWIKEREVLE